MLLIYAIAFGFALLVTGLIAIVDFDSAFGAFVITMLLLPVYLVFIGTLTSPLIFTSVRFYKHMISDQAYLTFTLPVPRYYHVVSKIITYAIWYLGSTIVSIASLAIAILTLSLRFEEFSEFFDYLFFLNDMSMDQIVAVIPGLIVTIILYYLVSLFSAPTYMFASFAWGQAMIKKHKLLGAFLCYLIINSATGLINGTISFFIQFAAMFSTDALSTITGFIDYYTITYATSALVQLGLGVVMYIITNTCLNKKLNLE